MTRLEALDAATERVDKMLDQKNERGFPRFSPTIEDRVRMILQLADFLVSEGEES